MRILLFLALVATMATACATPLPPTPPPAPAPEPEPDVYDEFEGEKVSADGLIRLGNTPVGVSGLRLVLSLTRTRWTEMPSPDGGVSRTGTAEMFVQRGRDNEQISITEGEAEISLGCRIKVVKVGEVYNQPTLRYVAYAELEIQEASAP